MDTQINTTPHRFIMPLSKEAIEEAVEMQDAQQVMWEAESHDELLGKIIKVAHLHKWICAHFRPARTSTGWRTPVEADAEGFPDLTLVRSGDRRILFIEVKTEKGKTTPAQEQWLEALRETGKCEVYLWRPSQWETIVAILERS